ncbi:MAG: phosphoenolpyruvate hydrolase family protein [Silicimonas sp.]|nr:phosphoenolpyruvate hydrolase family protein [Silicimonas sp.]
METLTLTGHTKAEPETGRIFCPSLAGLTAPQADLAFVLPGLDHNQALVDAALQGEWAAILTGDPFDTTSALFARLHQKGYRGVTNWPSSILLDGDIGAAMAADGIAPEQEYARLAQARSFGFETMGFILTLDHGRAAIAAGLDHLVLHPGLFETDSPDGRSLVQGALSRVLDTLKDEAPGLRLSLYTSPWHEARLNLSALNADGAICLEAGHGG